MEVYLVYSNKLKGNALGCRARKPFEDKKRRHSASLANLALQIKTERVILMKVSDITLYSVSMETKVLLYDIIINVMCKVLLTFADPKV